MPCRALLGPMLAGLVACSTIVGADFDDLRERPRESAGGMSALDGGGRDSGGKSGGGGAPNGSGGPSASPGGSGPASGASGDSGGAPSTGGASGGTSSMQAGATFAGGDAGSLSSGGAASGGAPDAGFGGTDGGAGAGSGGLDAGAGGMGEPAIVVINEVKGQSSGFDYIELFNLGPGTFDLAGYRLSDQDEDEEEDNVFVFPRDPTTLLPEGEYMLLLLGQTTAGGPFTCARPQPCFHATWGIAQEGEAVSLRDPQDQIVDNTFYPNHMGAGGLLDGQTWGRSPNGTGGFRATRATQERENLLP